MVTQPSFLTSNTWRRTILNLYACSSHLFPMCACALVDSIRVAFSRRKVSHEVPGFCQLPGFARHSGCANGHLSEL